ncbi:MAG: hypothetical protein KDA85_09525 [Planctomycetaceae bacterium]|nr:hypothetical protein [Planctomycetaceae bacterium]
MPSNSSSFRLIRWLLVLPVAVLTSAIVQIAISLILRFVVAGDQMPADRSLPVIWISTAVVHMSTEFSFVVADVLCAPGRRKSAAVALAVLSGTFALAKHIVLQLLAGNMVGTTNFIHTAMDLTGCIAGVLATGRLWPEHPPHSSDRASDDS